MKWKSNLRIKYIIIILLTQSFLLLIFNIKSHITSFKLPSVLLNIILFISICLSFLSIIMIKEAIKLINHEMKFKLQKVKLEEKEKLIESLRSQKHDFANHLQTLYGMVQLGKNKKAQKYIKSLSKDLANLKYEQTEVTNTILDSILVPKKEKAANESLKFNYQIDEGIENIKLPLNKIFRIVSNLVDNAIDATKDFNEECRIEIKGRNGSEEYILNVFNTGPIIEDKLVGEILEAGFSSKGAKRGYGLHIVKELVKEAGGRLEIESKPDYGTEFICYFPKD
ncbi:sensor histidine kinase [Acetohalobium arabaticum]|uniref:Signal transduction histidine kinase regulating citrate/malate metabolism n=1 Tax=Acetohalobium arabaticum (strain ATCC 49924 / DSM 5501 / Z-7288) TaxID=574087 RepID=D9QV69_ACEAZ|nr:ATP-binding protein [Acetohalobium arabaticum]ADL12128.1 signal transduction histidine kinase regulating citrate/malate metabolism [Acetohalobium arabaticum DSM 5501]